MYDSNGFGPGLVMPCGSHPTPPVRRRPLGVSTVMLQGLFQLRQFHLQARHVLHHSSAVFLGLRHRFILSPPTLFTSGSLTHSILYPQLYMGYPRLYIMGCKPLTMWDAPPPKRGVVNISCFFFRCGFLMPNKS